MSASRYHHIDGCAIVAVTDKAVLVRVPFEDDGTEEDIWFPRSQLADEGVDLKKGETDITVSATHWVCHQKGIETDE